MLKYTNTYTVQKSSQWGLTSFTCQTQLVSQTSHITENPPRFNLLTSILPGSRPQLRNWSVYYFNWEKTWVFFLQLILVPKLLVYPHHIDVYCVLCLCLQSPNPPQWSYQNQLNRSHQSIIGSNCSLIQQIYSLRLFSPLWLFSEEQCHNQKLNSFAESWTVSSLGLRSQ